MIFPVALLTFACIVGLKSGVETIGRFSELYIIHLIGLIAIFTLMAIPFMQVKNLLPIAENGVFPIIQGAFATFTFPFGETVILTMILQNIFNSPQRTTHYMLFFPKKILKI